MGENVKHTPGPWEARTFSVMGGHKLADRICHVGSSTSLGPTRAHESEANARLIAAAPDLLAALIAIEESAVILGANEAVSASAMKQARAVLATLTNTSGDQP
ncbi:hypothetical protein [Shinella oryzae]|uniref:Uncharacterized protein n=1 Tax=Shinella oryzae TaxID=2871820 RepID=A0ABY9K240_9HYPH|nr:hypothetical protein [Shinella oryzae]WLS01696.1 hypothetical protein Q9315_09565 [Shinella oryzae]